MAAAGNGLPHAGRSDESLVRELIDRHLRFTGSTLALAITRRLGVRAPEIREGLPGEYKRALTEMHAAKSPGSPSPPSCRKRPHEHARTCPLRGRADYAKAKPPARDGGPPKCRRGTCADVARRPHVHARTCPLRGRTDYAKAKPPARDGGRPKCRRGTCADVARRPHEHARTCPLRGRTDYAKAKPPARDGGRPQRGHSPCDRIAGRPRERRALNGQDHGFHGARAHPGGRAAAAGARDESYREFVMALTDDAASKQGARCMDCGTPFCRAAVRSTTSFPTGTISFTRRIGGRRSTSLHSTNNFPEFTGRLCPAPCEAACTLVSTTTPSASSRSSTHHRQGWDEGWVSRCRRRQDRQARRRDWARARPGSRVHSNSRARVTRRSSREERSHRRTSALRHSRLQDGAVAARPPTQQWHEKVSNSRPTTR